MKKVLIVTAVLPPHYGGADIAALRYSAHLNANSSIKVQLLGEWNAELGQNDSNSYPFLLPVRIYRLPRWKNHLRHISDYLNLLICFFSVFNIIFKNRSQFELIHCFNSSSNICIAAILSGKILRKPVITETSLMYSDDPLTLLKSEGLRSWVKVKWIKGKIFLLANKFISKSSYLNTAYRRTNLMNRAIEIPYAIDTSKYFPANKEEKKILRAQLGLPPEAIIILFVGGINPRKGVHLLVEAFRSLSVQYPNAFLLLVGPTDKYDPRYPASIKKDLYELGTEKARLIEGNSTIVDQYMRSADIYCLPSFREGFPISNLEAMASGLLVLASDIPEIKGTQIRPLENGIIFAKGQVEDLALKLDTALGSEELRTQLSQTAAAEAKQKFDLIKITQQYLEVYQSITS
jgi:glycosyltransferase involved in cell wall biosynthesis